MTDITSVDIAPMNAEHIPVPSGHAPRLKAVQNPDHGSLIVAERENDGSAWLLCGNPVEVER